ncbi:MAG: hypothetical protein M1837_004294 [Sclerophora amabilis]|nr:MAG: hypothetical protein M1837_004294 [Sclerophora amabilis]
MLSRASLVGLLALVPSVVRAQVGLDISPEKSAQLEEYLASVTAQPEFSSAAYELVEVLPTSVLNDIQDGDFLQEALTQTATPAWFTAMPTSLRNYFESVGSVELAIITGTGDVSIPAATATSTGFGSSDDDDEEVEMDFDDDDDSDDSEDSESDLPRRPDDDNAATQTTGALTLAGAAVLAVLGVAAFL